MEPTRSGELAEPLVHSDLEVDWSRSRAPFRGVYRGLSRVETFWDLFWSAFDSVQIETRGFTDVGSEVVVRNTAHMRGRDGIEVTARSALVFKVEDGRITRLRMFQEQAGGPRSRRPGGVAGRDAQLCAPWHTRRLGARLASEHTTNRGEDVNIRRARKAKVRRSRPAYPANFARMHPTAYAAWQRPRADHTRL